MFERISCSYLESIREWKGGKNLKKSVYESRSWPGRRDLSASSPGAMVPPAELRAAAAGRLRDRPAPMRLFYSGEVVFKQAFAIVTWTFLAVGLVTTPLLLLVMVAGVCAALAALSLSESVHHAVETALFFFT